MEEVSSDEDLDNRFLLAADYLPTIVPTVEVDKLLNFYGLFKQATLGKCNIPKPNWYAFDAKRKWEAWNILGDMSKDEAKKNYISLLSETSPGWENDLDCGIESSDRNATSGWVSVSTLKESDSEIEDSDKDIFDSVKDGDIEKVMEMGEGDVNILDEDGMGLIHWAADRGNRDMVRCILDLGADVNLRDNTGQTALHYACSCGHKDVVELLLERSADIGVACYDGFLAFDLADDEEIKTVIQKSKSN